MRKNLLATTAVVLALATTAFAQDNTTQTQEVKPEQNVQTQEAPAVDSVENRSIFEREAQMGGEDGYFTAQEGQILGSQLIGMSVHSGAGEEADRIGEVNDIVFTKDGTAEAVVIGVGGFLGIGEKDVAIDFDRLSWTRMENDDRLVVDSTKEQLEAAPAFDRTAMMQNADASAQQPVEGADANQTAATDPAQQPVEGADANQTAATDPAQQPVEGADANQTAANDSAQQPVEGADADTTIVVQPTDAQTTAAVNNREGMSQVDLATVSVDDLMGMRVYGANDENVGDIGDIRMTEDKQIEAFIVDVGGFLGIGEKPVAIDPSKVQIMRAQDGEAQAVYTAFTKEQLEAQPRFDADAWATERDTMMLR